jgi:hypothetical protein
MHEDKKYKYVWPISRNFKYSFIWWRGSEMCSSKVFLPLHDVIIDLL